MSLPVDLTFDAGIGQFSATQVEVVANTPAGREFLGKLCGTVAGVNPVSAVLRKTGAVDAFEKANGTGLICACGAA